MPGIPMTTEVLAQGGAASHRASPLVRLMAGQAGPVTVLVVAILAIWYVAAVWMNAPFARQIAADPAAMGTGELIAATMSLERPLLPAPHQVAAELYQTVLATPLTSRRSLVYHAWVTLSATLAPFELQLAYLGVDSRADDHFDEDAVGDRVALTALWRFSNQ